MNSRLEICFEKKVFFDFIHGSQYKVGVKYDC